MSIEQVKAEAKKRFDKDLTDEQGQGFLVLSELQDEELASVNGGTGAAGRAGKYWIRCANCEFEISVITSPEISESTKQRAKTMTKMRHDDRCPHCPCYKPIAPELEQAGIFLQ